MHISAAVAVACGDIVFTLSCLLVGASLRSLGGDSQLSPAAFDKQQLPAKDESGIPVRLCCGHLHMQPLLYHGISRYPANSDILP
jgi:hypothetical protein